MIYLLSDIHLEFFKKNQIDKVLNKIKVKAKKEDTILLAGDICQVNNDNFEYFFRGIQTLFKKIIYILGNHEFYNSSIVETINLVNIKISELNSQINNIILLNNDHYYLEDYDVIVIGTTLWSNLKYHNDDISKTKYLINDFNYINNFTPHDYQKLYEQNYKFLEEKLVQFKDSKKIIMTHHIPSYSLIDKKYDNDSVNSCFASNLDNLFDESIIAWTYGHTHTPKETTINNILFKCNPIGYIGENSTFTILNELKIKKIE